MTDKEDFERWFKKKFGKLYNEYNSMAWIRDYWHSWGNRTNIKEVWLAGHKEGRKRTLR